MASLLATDTASARGAVADLLGLALQTLGALGFGYAVAIYCDWRVALLVTGLLPVLVSGAVIQTRYATVAEHLQGQQSVRPGLLSVQLP